MTNGIELGVNQVAARVHGRLQRYLEAQYHIRDNALIEERRLALEEPGGISQRPFIEVTPSYAAETSFKGTRAPALVVDLLEEFSAWKPGIGVFPPYRHQAEALERFFAPGGGEDLVVATGTGSGKTETFLYALLGALAVEASERAASFARPGVRSLLLYPMNALVSDQTARLRKLLGDPRLAEVFRGRWGRHPLFGMYTSRTPYPGVRDSGKDKRHLHTLLSYYERLETSADEEQRALVRQLRERGRWPAKDIVRFFARDVEEKVTVKTGKRAGKEQTHYHWKERFLTQPLDRELMARHEFRSRAPDLLITNYSMLEYMLLRPIERPIFAQTREWLSADPRNQLLLVLDEAHMYRGVAGAEVGLLIRRLLSRLGIGRERLRCILTSASLSGGDDAAEVAKRFARGLTGQTDARDFTVIRGTPEPRRGAREGTVAEAEALAAVSTAALAAMSAAPGGAQSVLAGVASALGWAPPPNAAEDELRTRQHVCGQLTGFGPLEKLIETCSGNATPFDELAKALFPAARQPIAERATDGLLALGNLARRTEKGRQEQPLLPTRVHLLYRGLPPLYVCVNPRCSARRDAQQAEAIAGRLFTEPRTHCACGGRVFELLTHRDCGAAFLRVFAVSPTGDFFWHERGGTLTEFGAPLHEIHLLLEEPHPSARGDVEPVVLDIATGRALLTTAASTPGTRICYRAREPAEGMVNASTFGTCAYCTRRTQTGKAFKIMDLATKGEQPFANLVREQFATQLASKALSETHPNEGRKALLFSDGRQKAARLARDLPREVERDSFREAIALAVRDLTALPPSPQTEPVLDERLYAAFVGVCARFHLHFFDGIDQTTLLEECDRFRRHYGGDLALALESEWKPRPPTRYRQALLRQIGDPYYSLVAACAAVVEARRNKLNLARKGVASSLSADDFADIANAWIREMLAKSAFDPALSRDARLDEFGYFEPVKASDGLKQFFEKVRTRAGLDAAAVDALRIALFDVFTSESASGEDGRLLAPDALVLRLALDATWLQCAACGHLQAKAFFGRCSNCGERRLDARPPDDQYMRARKGFFRDPLRAVLTNGRPVHITSEEHTAQLSQRDAGVVYATTEEFELRFQDIALGKDKPPVDILSCTTTMEVGIDIGSLTAVGLRTVPPQRENYQQRAGRAGRRGTSVSSVLTFAQGGAHDAHYFANPAAMISGPPRAPRIKSDNRRLARRHIHSHIIQTFFHSQIDALDPEAQRQLAESRPSLMSAFGDAREFFSGTGLFTHAALDAWVRTRILVPNSDIADEIAAWLPAEIAPTSDGLGERRRFVREVAEGLLQRLDQMRTELTATSDATGAVAAAPTSSDADDDDGSLLNRFFDGGILPSYAFPTDLCSFVIHEDADHGQVRVAERPQLAKAQALSEYAPGRLLVVNKRTYRVGGIFIEGVPTASPAAPLFAKPLDSYIGCGGCAYVRMEPAAAASQTLDGAPCPVCGSPLFVRKFLQPPAFSPEAGRALREGDRDQEITYATTAQRPEPVERSDFQWHDGAGVHLRHAYGPDIPLVVVNKGKETGGFSVCQSCGASWLDGEEAEGAHARPFLLSQRVRAQERPPHRCAGAVQRGLFLVHQFRTDLLLLQASFLDPIDYRPEQAWFFDALATLSEALALGASLHLDIDPGELSAGFRHLPSQDESGGLAELFLFDTAAGGAGYAADAGADLSEVLNKTDDLLRSCPAKCERSCTKCLRHYGNRFLHTRLDRRLARDLLRYLRSGEAPPLQPTTAQAATLAPLARLLSLEGWSVEPTPRDGRPLAARAESGRAIVVGVYPALLRYEAARRGHDLRADDGELGILLPDYLIERDLPSAYQIACGLRPPPAPRRVRRVSAAPSGGSIIELPVRELRRATGQAMGSVRLRVEGEVPDGCYAARVPSGALAAAGFRAGEWLVLHPHAGEAPADTWHLVSRPRGNFGATREGWTIARLKRVGDDGARLQLSYGATAKEFRPERVATSEVTLVATLVARGTEEL